MSIKDDVFVNIFGLVLFHIRDTPDWIYLVTRNRS